MTQAVRLRAYLNHMLLMSATAVDGWALPPGLLEPFPADVLLHAAGVRKTVYGGYILTAGGSALLMFVSLAADTT